MDSIDTLRIEIDARKFDIRVGAGSAAGAQATRKVVAKRPNRAES
jgi:hypothetical protein